MIYSSKGLCDLRIGLAFCNQATAILELIDQSTVKTGFLDAGSWDESRSQGTVSEAIVPRANNSNRTTRWTNSDDSNSGDEKPRVAPGHGIDTKAPKGTGMAPGCHKKNLASASPQRTKLRPEDQCIKTGRPKQWGLDGCSL